MLDGPGPFTSWRLLLANNLGYPSCVMMTLASFSMASGSWMGVDMRLSPEVSHKFKVMLPRRRIRAYAKANERRLQCQVPILTDHLVS